MMVVHELCVTVVDDGESESKRSGQEDHLADTAQQQWLPCDPVKEEGGNENEHCLHKVDDDVGEQ